jgi:hypothetical protein
MPANQFASPRQMKGIDPANLNRALKDRGKLSPLMLAKLRMLLTEKF